jgi:hypothetical protein
MILCKVQLAEVHTHLSGGKTYFFRPPPDTSFPDEYRLSKEVPRAEFTVFVDNPQLQEQFQIGEFYYFDATPVPAAS